ncbi:MAG: hypothetical protein U1F43_29370 [Myxococcota bacterium]
MSDQPSDRQLEDVPHQVGRFLRAIAGNRGIAARMAIEGYRQEDHDLGWKLLHAVSGFGAPVVPASKDVAEAFAALDEIDGPLIRKVGAILRHDFTAQRDFILEGLAPAEGAAAVSNVRLVLERIARLESGEGRPAEAREQDLGAVAKLERRNLGTAVRQRLAGQVAIAVSFDEEAARAGAAELHSRVDRLRPQLVALWEWYDEWRAIAHEAISRRDYKISLGIAERREPADPTTRPPATTPPIATA